ncbi:hypothetical protein ACFVP3_23520 [Streptomyces sp. NPDC057806]|uniref:hypothetical protein n=1 Tax=Streptomyces sp. NPDC057806 TaxID=3346255 RepID=UPI0036B3EE75
MSGSRVVGVIAAANLLVAAVVMLLAHVTYGFVARHFAQLLRDHADRMQTLNPLRTEPVGIRYAADLIDRPRRGR